MQRARDVESADTKRVGAASGHATTHSLALSWPDTTVGDRTLTSFSITDAGHIDLGYVPGLEEVSQDDFVGFAQITFSTPGVKLDDEKAFAIAAVLLDHDGKVRLGALHAR